MSRVSRGSDRAVLRALQRLGFVVTHVRGSHYYLRRPGEGGLVVVPVHGHRDLPVGTMQSILRQAGMTAEELASLL
ncbi:MAG: type II toxin-antitoxin system HicA family toxin [Firmicutes bacterium]|nr:type II toxin-antitoxin system HicA family toxin [Bacillota bacterium]